MLETSVFFSTFGKDQSCSCESPADHTVLRVNLDHFVFASEFAVHGVLCVDDGAVVLSDDLVLVDGPGGEESLPRERKTGRLDLQFDHFGIVNVVKLLERVFVVL